MKLQDVKDFYPTAKQRLEKAPEEKKIVMLYAAIIIGMAVLGVGINYLLNIGPDPLGRLPSPAVDILRQVGASGR